MSTIRINYNLFSLQGWYWTGITSLLLFIDELLIPSWPGPPQILSAPDYKIKIFKSSFVEVNSSHGIASKFNSSYYLASQWLTRYKDQIYRVWIPWVDFFFKAQNDFMEFKLPDTIQFISHATRSESNLLILCAFSSVVPDFEMNSKIRDLEIREFPTKIFRPKFCPLNEIRQKFQNYSVGYGGLSFNPIQMNARR